MPDQPTADAATTDVETHPREGGTPVRGTIRVAPAVLIELIELTVRDVDGVVELRSRPRKPRQAPSPQGKTFDDGKVRVTVHGDHIETDLAVAIRNGVGVAAITRDIREQVGQAVARMLGMTASSINIYIDAVVDV